jgi:hypothetical protein
MNGRNHGLFLCIILIFLSVFIVLFNDVVKFYTGETKRSYVECCSRKEGSEIARLLGEY